MIREHYAAVKSQLLADAALRVFDSARVDAAGLVREQYVILFGGGPSRVDPARLTAPDDVNADQEYTYTTRSVGVSADGCMMTAEKVGIQLAGFVPVITGRRFSPMRRGDGDAKARPDVSVIPAMFYLDQDWILLSLRA